MTESILKIRVIEKEHNAMDVFLCDIVIDEHQNLEIEIPNPQNKAVDQELEWYFEKYLHEPYEPMARIEKCKSRLRQYGETLFQRIFKDKVLSLYQKNISTAGQFSALKIEIEGHSAAFESIIWESIKDPQFEGALTTKGALVARVKPPDDEKSGVITIDTPFIYILVVTARPAGVDDVNYRTIQRPLVEVTENSEVRVKVDILRPGTLSALIKHLELKGPGYYTLVHFDLHGAVLSFAELERARESGLMVFDAVNKTQEDFSSSSFSLTQETEEPIELGKSKTAFLFFESGISGKSMPVQAVEIAKHLRFYKIPICILNACQSAKQENIKDETSLGKILIANGVSFVVGMRYSVSVSAASQFMSTLYTHLSNRSTLEKSVALARQELRNIKTRKAALGYEIELEDWVLPIVYQRHDVNINLTELGETEAIAYYQHQQTLLKNNVSKGFYGRDLVILEIENHTRNSNQILLTGMVGIGKSSLLKYLHYWWQRTDFVYKSAYIDFGMESLSKHELINQISREILPSDHLKEAKKDQELVLLETLNTRKYSIFLDNIFNLKDDGMISFLQQIKKSIVMYSSVNQEPYLSKATCKEAVFSLPKLDEEAVMDISADILTVTGMEFDAFISKSRDDFNLLLLYTERNPLVLKKILPHLKEMSIQNLIVSYHNGTI